MSFCPTGKRQYFDAADAQAALDRLVKRWKDGTLNDPCFAKRGYSCPSCGRYHLTKQDPRVPNPKDVYAR